MQTLLLHGALGSKSQLDAIKIKLEQNGREVFSMNFSGHSGEAFSKAGFGIEIFAQDVKRFLYVHKIQKPDIFGYSMGGYVALWLAYLYPDVVNSIVTLGTKFDWNKESAAREVEKMNAEKIELKVPAFARILEHRHAPNDWKELLHKTSTMMSALGDKPLLNEEILKHIQTPVLIVLGDKDDMADRSYSERVAQLLPNGEFRLLENTPHAIEKVTWVPWI
jgi:pimeloyl-ACP methyl ester carboxylesterase